MLEHAVNLSLSRGYDDGEGRRPAIDVRRSAIISRDKRLRNLKIETIESGAAIKALEMLKESLETLWKTTNTTISARYAQPTD